MSPSQRQLSALSPEDRRLYRLWLRRCLLLYGAIAFVGMIGFSYHVTVGSQTLAASDSARSALAAAR